MSGPFEPVRDDRPDDRAWPALRWPLDAGTVLVGDVVQLSVVRPEEDAGPLFAALDHDEVWQHVAGRPASPEQYAAMLRERVAGGVVPWMVRRRGQGGPGPVVGTSSYLDVSVPDARLEIGSTAYAPQVWGTAVNPEVKLLLLGLAFDGLGAGRVQLKTDVRNVRSQRAIAALGARFEGTLRRYQRRADGTVRDTVLFSVLAEEWPEVRDRLVRRLSRS